MKRRLDSTDIGTKIRYEQKSVSVLKLSDLHTLSATPDGEPASKLEEIQLGALQGRDRKGTDDKDMIRYRIVLP